MPILLQSPNRVSFDPNELPSHALGRIQSYESDGGTAITLHEREQLNALLAYNMLYRRWEFLPPDQSEKEIKALMQIAEEDSKSFNRRLLFEYAGAGVNTPFASVFSSNPYLVFLSAGVGMILILVPTFFYIFRTIRDSDEIEALLVEGMKLAREKRYDEAKAKIELAKKHGCFGEPMDVKCSNLRTKIAETALQIALLEAQDKRK